MLNFTEEKTFMFKNSKIYKGIEIIINDYYDFFIEAKNKYVKLYPKSKELIDNVKKNMNKSSN